MLAAPARATQQTTLATIRTQIPTAAVLALDVGVIDETCRLL